MATGAGLARWSGIAGLALLTAGPACAQTPPDSAQPEIVQPSGAQPDVAQPGSSQGLWQRANLFGDPGGQRSRLADAGVTFGLAETSEVLGNPTGGERQGAVYEGLTQFGLGIDMDKAFGLAGGTFNVTGYQVHGRGLSLNNLDNNGNTVSSIEALRGTLLFELWYEQVLADKALAIRVGQLAADQEFQISQYGVLFINHTFGWSTLPSADLPSGGPAFPLATPGVRVRYSPTPSLNLLLGVFNGDPAGPGTGLPQRRDPSGTAFRIHDGALVIGEAQYAASIATGLPGTYKFGAWYDTQGFADQRSTASGRSLADPAVSDATGRIRFGNYSVYAVADQLVWRDPGADGGGIGVFARAMGAPGDRNLVNFYVDAGIVWKAPFPGRGNDSAGLAFGLSRVSDTASQLDADTARLTGKPYPIRRHESVLELTYQAQLAPWLQLQPTAQYVFNPNGGVPDPLQPAKRLSDAAVFGLRASVTF